MPLWDDGPILSHVLVDEKEGLKAVICISIIIWTAFQSPSEDTEYNDDDWTELLFIHFLMNVYDYVNIYYICSIIIDPINDMFMFNLFNSNIQSQRHASNIPLSCYED